MTDAVRRGPIRRSLNACFVVVGVIFCVAIILALVFDVQRRLDALGQASSDNGQWSLAQVEVETLLLQNALAAQPPNLTEIRKRFDILYPRVVIFDTSPLYAGLRERSGFNSSLIETKIFLQRSLPLIDGPETDPIAALPTLHDQAQDLRATVRAMSLAGMDYFSTAADRPRNEMARTLRGVAGLTGFLIVALSILAVVLTRLYLRSRAQAAENRLTTTRLETIVSTSVDAIVVVNRRGIVLAFNPAAETTFGFSRAEALGHRVTNLIVPPDAIEDTIKAIEAQLIRAEAQAAGRQRIELEAVRKDRSRFPVEISVARAENAEGEIFVAFIRDISDRRQAEQNLTETRDLALKGDRAKAEFLAVMSHEMRTPLNGLLGSVDILGATQLTPAQRELLKIIETSGQLLLQHVNSVLDLSSAAAKAQQTASTPFVVEALVREVIANQSGLAAAHGSRIDLVAVTEAVGRVIGDPARLRQILLNLVGNAVKFTRNGRITVEIEAEPAESGTRMVEFRVIDSGIGIAEADQDKVFEDFVTLNTSYGREAGGTGLGLGITRRLVQALGGEIGMESEPGQGSVFWVRLPFGTDAEPSPAGQEAQREDDARLRPRVSVLVIEDNAINRFVLRALLEEVNHDVTEAMDGIEGLAAAEASAYDVILMDISMPSLGGIEAARRIRGGSGKSREARIVAVTAHAMPEELDRFRDAGIDDYIIKPVTRSTLAHALAGRQEPVPSHPAQAPANSPLIDPNHLSDLLGRLDDRTAADLMRRFVEEGDRLVGSLTACPPPPDLERICHGLAGSAATFGARRLVAILEAMSISQRTEGALSGLQGALAETWDATRAALGQARPSLAAPAQARSGIGLPSGA